MFGHQLACRGEFPKEVLNAANHKQIAARVAHIYVPTTDSEIRPEILIDLETTQHAPSSGIHFRDSIALFAVRTKGTKGLD